TREGIRFVEQGDDLENSLAHKAFDGDLDTVDVALDDERRHRSVVADLAQQGRYSLYGDCRGGAVVGADNTPTRGEIHRLDDAWEPRDGDRRFERFAAGNDIDFRIPWLRQTALRQASAQHPFVSRRLDRGHGVPPHRAEPFGDGRCDDH